MHINISDLISAEASSDRVAKIARTALNGAGDQEYPAYFAALDSALADELPPFGTRAYSDLYFGAAADARWMAVSLMTNAEREGDGATRLWSLSACSRNEDEQLLLKVHAVDESRHALFYLRLLDLAFPGETDPAFRLELQKLSPRYSLRMESVAASGSPYARAPSIDDFIQINIAEIRTTIHHLMQRSALSAHSSLKNHAQIVKILDPLLKDELRHVAYTARHIEYLAQVEAGIDLKSLFRKRLRDFNKITSEEVGKELF